MRNEKMKFGDLFDVTGNPPATGASISLDDVHPDDRHELAGMLRGLMYAIEGRGNPDGMTGDVVDGDGPVVIVHFSSVANATRFKNCVRYFFDSSILTGMKVKRRVGAAPQGGEIS